MDYVKQYNPLPKKAVVTAIDLTKDPVSNFEEVKEDKLVEEISDLKCKIFALEKEDNKNKTRVKCYNCKKYSYMSKYCRSKKKFESKNDFSRIKA